MCFIVLNANLVKFSQKNSRYSAKVAFFFKLSQSIGAICTIILFRMTQEKSFFFSTLGYKVPIAEE